MNIPPAALAIITRFESLRLEPYRDEGGVLTVGWGHTGPGAKEGRTITEQDAVTYLKQDVKDAFDAVVALVKVPLNENQLSALISFFFNLGNTRATRDSTLLRLLNGGDYAGAADEFWKWRKVGAEVSNGLVRRRGAEEQLFLTPPTPQTHMSVLTAEEAARALVDESETVTAQGIILNPEYRDAVVTVMTKQYPIWQPTGEGRVA